MLTKIQNLWANNKLAIIWLIVTCTYLTLKVLKIDAPEFTNAFVLVNGAFVGDIGIKQAKKKSDDTIRIEKKADAAVAIADSAVEAATGGLPPLVQDSKTGEVRIQEPPRIARPGDDNA